MARRSSGLLGKWMIGAIGTAAAVAWFAARRRAETFAGRLVVVTGGSRGHGLLLAREFGERGARVVILARDTDELDRAAHQLGGEGLDVYPFTCDVRDRDQVDRVMAEIEAMHGPVDVLVNNAGVLHVGHATAFTHADLEDAMATNFWGAVHTIEAVLPSMLARHDGRIVNIASVGGFAAVPFMLPYCASKGALLAYSLSLGYDLSREGISVTVVNPWIMRTGGPINGTYKGSIRRGLFAGMSFADTSLLLAVDPRRVARMVVRAAARRESIVYAGWRARLVAVLQGVMPRTMGAAFRTVVRAMPQSFTSVGEGGRALAHEVRGPWRAVVERSRARNNQPADEPHLHVEGTPVADDVARLQQDESHSPAE